MKPILKTSRGDLVFLAVLFALVLATVLLWFADPNHRPTGGSRIPWPAAAPAGH